MVGGAGLRTRAATASPARRRIADALAAQIDVLRSRQNEQGGFGLWTATPDSEPFVSAYTMHFLLEARDRGVAVPKDMIDAGNKYLQRAGRRSVRRHAWTNCASAPTRSIS